MNNYYNLFIVTLQIIFAFAHAFNKMTTQVAWLLFLAINKENRVCWHKRQVGIAFHLCAYVTKETMKKLSLK